MAYVFVVHKVTLSVVRACSFLERAKLIITINMLVLL